MNEMLVTMRDFRACKMCGPGTLKFFHAHKDLRRELIKEGGIPISKLEAIDDAMLAQVTDYARGKDERRK